MSNSKIVEFHESFIRSLVFVGLVTLVSMVSARYIVRYIISTHYQTHEYTIQESQIKPE